MFFQRFHNLLCSKFGWSHVIHLRRNQQNRTGDFLDLNHSIWIRMFYQWHIEIRHGDVADLDAFSQNVPEREFFHFKGTVWKFFSMKTPTACRYKRDALSVPEPEKLLPTGG